MRRRSTTGNSDDNELINLTPLLDVLFVVLILFIIIAPLTKLDWIDLTESSSKTLSPSSMDEPFAFDISLYANDTLAINGKLVEKQTLRLVLQEIQKTSKDAIPRLYIDKKSSFGAFSETKDLIEDCGFAYLDLVVKSNGNAGK